jgi:hypothetical protein
MEQHEFSASWWVYVIVMIVAFLEFVLADVLADRSFPFDTERKLDLMEKRLGTQALTTIAARLEEVVSGFEGCDPAKISATVHVLAELTSTADNRIRIGLLQLTDYIGSEGGKKGRITLITQGIIGRCARTGRLETVDFADAHEYQTAMVREFGFTEKEASRHSKNARSYLAFPLRKRDETVGVIYFFTSEPQVFPLAAHPQRLDETARELVNYLSLAQIV